MTEPHTEMKLSEGNGMLEGITHIMCAIDNQKEGLITTDEMRNSIKEELEWMTLLLRRIDLRARTSFLDRYLLKDALAMTQVKRVREEDNQ